jgi:succinate dehydrogenase / fumarate reductase flavoprotein subunit/fumarate reductase flavoprotein subunit
LVRIDGENPFQLRDQLERIMWTKVGVVRNGPDMQSALPEIQDIHERVKSACASCRPSPYGRRAGGEGARPSLNSQPSTLNPIYNAPWNEAINTENLATIAEMLTRSALLREESRGAHYRSDFQQKDPNWLKNICMKPLDDGDYEITYLPVRFTRLTPPEKGQTLKSVAITDDE